VVNINIGMMVSIVQYTIRIVQYDTIHLPLDKNFALV